MTEPDTSAWGARNAHDPTIVRGDDGLWYMFSTDAAADVEQFPAGAHVRTSPDLVEWTFRGTALDGVPQAAAAWSGATGLWAPEVVRWPTGDGEQRWHMYYSASTFGSRTSAIGLAVAPDPAGPWTDHGIVIATEHDRDEHNAIDAAIAFDRDGEPWMIYGSFFGGIHALELSLETGMPRESRPATLVARRPRSVDGAIEGAYVVERDGRYFLFVSYDSLVDTYSVRVGVADHITGPYRDQQGRDMTSPADADAVMVGTKVLGGMRLPGGVGLIAPGHNSIFHDGDATFMVHHVRLADAPTQHEAQVRRVHWTASGWPVVSPHPFAGIGSERLTTAASITGEWDAVRFAPEVAELVDSQRVTVSAEGTSDGDAVRLRLRLTAATESVTLDAVVFGAWDPVAQRVALAFSGIDEHGVVWSGSQAVTG